jgi:hypothetical protein
MSSLGVEVKAGAEFVPFEALSAFLIGTGSSRQYGYGPIRPIFSHGGLDIRPVVKYNYGRVV